MFRGNIMKNRFLISLISCLLLFSACGSNSPSSEPSDSQNPPHTHSFSSVWKKDDTYHWHKCNGCDEIKDKSEHNYGSWVIDAKPTEEATGKRHKNCLTCGYEVEEIMPVVDHVHNWDTPTYTWSYDNSKCTASRECTINRYHVETETVNSAYQVITEPTTTSTGVGRYTATFTNSGFSTQTKNVILDKIGIAVTGISLTPASTEISVGGTTTLIAVVSPSNASNKKINWTCTDLTVVSGSITGSIATITGTKVGNAIVYATTEDGGFSASCSITVISNIPVTGVSLSSNNITLEEGQTKLLYETVSPSNATNKNVSWESSDTSVVTVNNTGKITAVKAGTATITVTTQDGGFTATCSVNVTEKANFTYEIGDSFVTLYAKYSSDYIRVYAPVTNTGNVNIYIGSCSFNVEDSEGNLQQTLSYADCYPNIIRPGETTYVYKDTTYSGAVKEGLVAIPAFTIKNAMSADDTRYQVDSVEFYLPQYSSMLRAKGTVTNNTESKSSSLVYVAILTFDAENNYLYTFMDLLSSAIEPGDSVEYETSGISNITADLIDHYETYAYEYTIVI